MISRIDALQLIRKFDGPSSSDAVDLPRPFCFRPRWRGEKDDLMAGCEDAMGQTSQIDFSAAAHRKPAANKSNLQIFLRHQVFTCTVSAQYLFACRVKH